MLSRIDAGAYARSMGIRFATVVVLTIAFPWLTLGAIEATGARLASETAGAIALMFGIFVKPIIYGVFLLSCIGISIRRAKTIGLDAKIGWSIPLLVFAEWHFGVALGSFWATPFAMGVLSLQPPVYLCLAAMTTITLSLLADREEWPDEATRGLYTLWVILLTTGAMIGTIFALPGLPFVPFWAALQLGYAGALITGLLYKTNIFPFIFPLAFAATSAALVWKSRSGQRKTPEAPTGKRPTAPGTFGKRIR